MPKNKSAFDKKSSPVTYPSRNFSGALNPTFASGRRGDRAWHQCLRFVTNFTLALTLNFGSSFVPNQAVAADQELPVVLRYASDLPLAQKQLIELDLSRLTTPQFSVTAPEVIKLFDQTEPVTAQVLRAWLKDRVRIIISGTYEYSVANFDYVNTSYRFPMPGLFPSDNRDARILNQNSLATKTMDRSTATNQDLHSVLENLGAAAYADSKKADQGLRALSFPGLGRVVLSTPRVGIVKIDEGFFPLGHSNEEFAQYPNSLVRLSQLFHEGRHSDGNGLTQGFFHVICPAGSGYAGKPICDSSRNGAYTVQAQVLKAYTESCKTCSIAMRERMRLNYVDAFSRVIKQMPIVKTHSTDELGQLLDQCNKMISHGWKVPRDCPLYQAELESQKANRPPSRTTIDWDDAPEGLPPSAPAS